MREGALPFELLRGEDCAMKDDSVSVGEMLRYAAMARFRVLRVEGEEHGDLSWQRVTCHLHREDVPCAAVPLIYALGVLSFDDARPRESSEIEYEEKDEWLFSDLTGRLRLERGTLLFDSDYVRGRMMKTRIRIASDGRFVIETRNRYEMTRRWLDRLRGVRHIRMAPPGGESVSPRG